MKEKRFNLLLILQLALMFVLIIVSIISAVIIFTGNIPEGFEASAKEYNVTTSLYGIAHIVNALALTCSIVYFLLGSGKEESFLYKGFIFLAMVSVVLRMIGTLIYPGFGVSVCLMILIIFTLFALTFGINLGKNKTWILFYALLAFELALAIFMFDKNEILPSIVGNLSRLVLAGSIGISINAKYKDKASRGKE